MPLFFLDRLVGDTHEENYNSVNVTLKERTMQISSGRGDQEGKGERGYGGIMGDRREVEKYTGFYHHIFDSD